MYTEDRIWYKPSYYFIRLSFIFLLIATLKQKQVVPLHPERTLGQKTKLKAVDYFSQ